MIIFDGIKQNSKMAFLSFSNEQKHKVDIPIELSIANRITHYLNLISLPPDTCGSSGDNEDQENVEPEAKDESSLDDL
jgi:hypothetical protein